MHSARPMSDNSEEEALSAKFESLVATQATWRKNLKGCVAARELTDRKHLTMTAVHNIHLFCIVLIGLMVICTAGVDMYVGMSLPFSAQDTALRTLIAPTMYNSAKIAFDVNNEQLSPNDCEPRLSVLALDDAFNATLLFSNYASLSTNPQVVALMPSTFAVPAVAEATSAATNGTLAFFSSWSGELGLFSPFRRNVINLRPSYQDEAAAILHFLTNSFLISRISFVYSDDEYGSPSMSAAVRLLPSLGLSAVSVNVVVSPFSVLNISMPADYSAAVDNITRSSPQAVVVFGLAATFAKLLATGKAMGVSFSPDIVWMTGSLGGLVVDNWFAVFNASDTAPPNYYIPSPVPAIVDVSNGPAGNGTPHPLVADYLAARAKYAPNTPLVEFVSLSAYVSARYVATALRAGRNRTSRASLLDAVYDYPMVRLANDFVYGPFTENPPCNTGLRRLFIIRQYANFSAETQWNATFSWNSDRCSALSDDVRLPVLFAAVTPARRTNPGHHVSPRVDSINAVFAATNEEGSLAAFGRPTYLLALETDGSTAGLVSTTSTLVNQTNMMAVVGLNRTQAAVVGEQMLASGIPLIAPASGAPEFFEFSEKRPELRGVFNLRASWHDEAIVAVDYWVAVGGAMRFAVVAPDDSDGEQFVKVLERALEVYLWNVRHHTALWAKAFYSPTDSSQSLHLPIVDSGDTVDVVFVFCPDAVERCVEAINELSLESTVSGSLWRPKAVQLIWAFDSTHLLTTMKAGNFEWYAENATNRNRPFEIVLSSSYPSPWQRNDTVDNTAVAAYWNLISRAPTTIQPSLESFEGFVSAHFILSIVGASRNNITRSSLVSTVYSQLVVPLFSDLTVAYFLDTCLSPKSSNGDPYECCNQGARSIYFLRLVPDSTAPYGGYWEPQGQRAIGGCHATIPAVPTDNSDSSSNSFPTVAVVTSSVIGGICIFAAIIVATVLHWRFAERGGPARPAPKEPDYRRLALAATTDMLDRARVETLFLGALPAVPLKEREVRSRLAKLESSLLADLEMTRWMCRVLIEGKGGITVEASELAVVVCLLFHAGGRCADLLAAFAAEEVRMALSGKPSSMKTSGTITLATKGTQAQVLFRQDDLLSKMYKMYTRLVGLPWLWNALTVDMDEIEYASTHASESSGYAKQRRKRTNSKKRREGNVHSSSSSSGASSSSSSSSSSSGSSNSSSGADTTTVDFGFSLEIDPKKAKKGDDVVANVLQLKLAAHRIVQSLAEAVQEFPEGMRDFLLAIRWALEESRGVAAHELVQPAIAAFVFLRFICPAITSPHTHGLFRSPPNAPAQRFLVLLSKVLINIATGAPFEKEDFMVGLNESVVTHAETIREMLEAMSTSRLTVKGTTASEANSSVVVEIEPTVKVGDSLKERCLKMMYYYIASHQHEILHAMQEAEEHGTVHEKRQARAFVALMKAVSIINDENQSNESDLSVPQDKQSTPAPTDTDIAPPSPFLNRPSRGLSQPVDPTQ